MNRARTIFTAMSAFFWRLLRRRSTSQASPATTTPPGEEKAGTAGESPETAEVSHGEELPEAKES